MKNGRKKNACTGRFTSVISFPEYQMKCTT